MVLTCLPANLPMIWRSFAMILVFTLRSWPGRIGWPAFYRRCQTRNESMWCDAMRRLTFLAAICSALSSAFSMLVLTCRAVI